MNSKKKVSIYGDSISTYSGYNPEGYAVYYAPIPAEIGNSGRTLKITEKNSEYESQGIRTIRYKDIRKESMGMTA